MIYWFDKREVTLTACSLALFWGIILHQMVCSEADARFVVIYVPISVFLALPALSRLREAIFRGSVVEALVVKDLDADQFVCWRNELLSDDETAAGMPRDEIVAHIRRLAHQGWRDLRAVAPLAPVEAQPDADRLIAVEKMARFIGEHCREEVRPKTSRALRVCIRTTQCSSINAFVGIIIKQSIIHHRLDAAQSMLIAADRPIASIAFDCGFGSLSSFYEAFDKRFKASPAKFRSLLRRRAA
jgi:AraC family transcriptional regulator, melibiose operon regulatory protein